MGQSLDLAADGGIGMGETHVFEVVSALCIQAEGHPSVRVFAAPVLGSRAIGTIKSHSQIVIDAKHTASTGSYYKAKLGELEGWVGAKNVKLTKGTRLTARQFSAPPPLSADWIAPPQPSSECMTGSASSSSGSTRSASPGLERPARDPCPIPSEHEAMALSTSRPVRPSGSGGADMIAPPRSAAMSPSMSWARTSPTTRSDEERPVFTAISVLRDRDALRPTALATAGDSTPKLVSTPQVTPSSASTASGAAVVEGVPPPPPSIASVSSAESETPTSSTMHFSACPLGTKCNNRADEHLGSVAHPFDVDYRELCAAAMLQPEEPSLLGLFQWVDKDGSGKVSREELEEAFPLLSMLMGERVVITEKGWQSLDEDGNGYVNFSKFSSWAGPRLGLPLGVPSRPSIASVSSVEPEVPTSSATHFEACPLGTKCKLRTDEHLHSVAHPFDVDYRKLCAAAMLQPEEPSLLGLFQWVDKDGSGKVSREELEEAFPLLSLLMGEKVVITEKGWQSLDEDGNGYVNFSEFSSWAGPRLGLPLGVKHLFQGKAVDECHGCAIIGCPCEGFVKKQKKGDAFVRTSRQDKPNRHSSFFESIRSRLERNTQICTCGHKFAAHNMRTASDGEVPYPLYWEHRDSTKGDFTHLVPVRAESLKLFQSLLDQTYSSVFTRDRRKHNPKMPNVPRGYSVVRAFRSENSRIWREYGIKRAQLILDAEEQTFHQYSDVMSSKAWVANGGALAERLKPEINEWYLFHGCGTEAAQNICKGDFNLGVAGSKTGTLYGRGIYFAESITKADEYAKPDENGVYTVLLTRVVGGHVKYTDEVRPDPEDLCRSCIEGPYDGIVGDRRKTRGTYREFIFYDSENLYAEYIIQYTRTMASGHRLQVAKY